MSGSFVGTQKRAKYQQGEYIALYWDDEPEVEFIRGHVSREDASDILTREGMEPLQPNEAVQHLYGRWSCEPYHDGIDHILRLYSEPGRGRFTVTAVMIHGNLLHVDGKAQ